MHTHTPFILLHTLPDAVWHDNTGLSTSFNRFRLYPALITIEMTRTIGLLVACAVNHDTVYIGLQGLRRSSDFNAG